jgi:hypothetical protein
MNASEIQTIVLQCLVGRYYRIVADETYLLSGEPDEESDNQPRQTYFILQARMDKNDFFAFRNDCNAQKVWIVATYKEVPRHDGVFDYHIIATEKW